MGSQTLGDMIVRIVGENADFDSSIDRSEAKFKKFGDSVSRIGKGMSKWVTAPIMAIGTAVVKATADMEMYQTSFETMLGGSAEKATAFLNVLKDMAAKTPFMLSDLAQSSKTLMGFGVAAEDTIEVMRRIGDVSQGNRERFQQLSLAYAQIQAAGRLMGQDLLQLINAGFNPLQVISKNTGKSMAQLKDEMSKGAISAQMVADAFKSATSEGGKFYNGMEKASQTFSGLLSTLADDAMELGRQFGTVLLPYLKDGIKWLSSIIKSFGQLDDGTKRTILKVVGLVAAIGPLLTVVGKLITILPILGGAIGALFAAMSGNPIILAISLALGILIPKVIELVNAFKAQKEAEEKLNKDTQKMIDLSVGIIDSRQKIIALEKGYAGVALDSRQKILRMDKEILQLLKDQQAELDKAATRTKQVQDKRIANEKDYNDAVKQNTSEMEAGLISYDDMVEKNIDAAKKLASALIEQGYTGDLVAKEFVTAEGKKVSAIQAGDRTLNSILGTIAEYNNAQAEMKNMSEKVEAAQERVNGIITGPVTTSLRQFNDDVSEATDKTTTAIITSLRQFNDDTEAIDEQISRNAYEAAEKVKESWKAAYQEIYSAVFSVMGSLSSIAQAESSKEEKRVAREYDTKIEAIEAEIDARKEAGKDYADLIAQKTALEEEAQKKKDQLEYDAAMTTYKYNVAQAIMDSILAGVRAFSDHAWPMSGIIAAAVAVKLGAQIAALKAAVPDPPKAATGMDITPEGNIIVGENGMESVALPQGSRIFNASETDMAMRNIPSDSSGQDYIILTVDIDSDPILKKIFPATKNRKVLISNGAVV